MPAHPTKPGPAPDGFAALTEGARHVIAPSGIVATAWPSVRDTCAGFGVTFDPWQDGAGRLILAKRADGRYAASIGGVVISIPRQVGKTFLIGAIVFALCLLHPGTTVLWTAHRTRTASETFAKMQAFSRRKKVRPHVAKIVLGSGFEAVVFHNGSRVLFGARERGFGRGFDDIDVEVFDEAQILTENAIDDMVPATNTATNPLLLFVGTPPKPSDPSEVFAAKRAAALSGEDHDTAYIECSADDDADPNDRAQWAKANLSYPRRTSETAMLRMKKNLTLDSFVREALGVWDNRIVRSIIDPADWAKLHDTAPEVGDTTYGVKFSPDGETVALAAAIRPVGGKVHVEGIEHRSTLEGVGWLEDWLVERAKAAHVIVLDGKSGAGAMEIALAARGVAKSKVVRPTTEQVIAAHALMLSAVAEGQITNVDDPATAASFGCAGRRQIGRAGGWGFAPITEDGDVTLAESIVMAHWGTTVETKKAAGTFRGARR